jgi:pseudoazurin
LVLATLLAFGLAAHSPVTAQEIDHVVRVVEDPTTGLPRFDPAVLFVAPGETVRFAMGGKAYASRVIAGMTPEGGQGWWGQVGEDLEITFTEPGVYGHKCGGAYALGLVGLVVVGDPSVNLQAARLVQHPPRAASVLDSLFSLVEASQGS